MRKSKTNAQKIRNRYAQLVVRAGDHNKAEILYEYDRAMDRLARLYLFANSAPSEDEIEIQERSERLAKDDLLNFSVHCRRLFEITKAFPLAKAIRIPTCKFEKNANSFIRRSSHKPGETVWKIINAALHHDKMQIWTSSWDVDIRVFSIEPVKALTTPRQRFRPVVILGSDKVKMICFELRVLVKEIGEEILEPLVEALSSKGVYVELDMREF